MSFDMFPADGGREMLDVPNMHLAIEATAYNENSSEEVIDVFEGIEFNCPSELNTPSESESEHSDSPERPFRRRLIIGKHITRNEEGDHKFTCTICNASFSNKYNIRYHDYCVSGKRPLRCHLCDKRFVKRSHLNYHVRTHTGESPYSCSTCKKQFKDKAKLNRHEKTHNRNEESLLICPICNKKYSDKDSLKKHEQRHANNNSFKCNTCKKRFSDIYTLKQHMATHKGPRFICDVCGKTFMRANSLNVHKQIHDDVYPFVCEECHKTFRTRKELNLHGVVHKDGPGFECNMCSIKCGRKDNLLRHIRNCHLDPCNKKTTEDVPLSGEENIAKVPENKAEKDKSAVESPSPKQNFKPNEKETKKSSSDVKLSDRNEENNKKALRKKSGKTKVSKKLRSSKENDRISLGTGKDDSNLLSDSSLTLDLSPPSLGVLENMTAKYSNLLISSHDLLEKKNEAIQNSEESVPGNGKAATKNSEFQIIESQVSKVGNAFASIPGTSKSSSESLLRTSKQKELKDFSLPLALNKLSYGDEDTSTSTQPYLHQMVKQSFNVNNPNTLQTEACCNEPEKAYVECPLKPQKTSVIVHTSSFNSLVLEANASREPVIKFLKSTSGLDGKDEEALPGEPT